MRWWLLSLVWVTGCTRCGGQAIDAGVDAGVQVHRSTDLRNVFMQSLPEYRDLAVLDSSVRLTRVIPGLTALARDEGLAKMKWSVSDAGAGWDLNRFHLDQAAHDTLVMSLPLTIDDVVHLFLSPTTLSSMDMAMYLPRQLPIGRETFEVDLHYSSSPERCRIRVRQAVSLLVASGRWRVTNAPPSWSPDAAGDTELPENFVVEVSGVDGSHLVFDRARGQVRVRYSLETVSPPR